MEMNIKFPKLNLNNIKGVLLDLDNTLYDYDYAHMKAIDACYRKYKININASIDFDNFYNLYRKKRNSITKRLETKGACRSRLFAFQEIFEEQDLKNNWGLALDYEEIYWSTLIKNMILSTDSLLFLQSCKKMHIDVCIVTDMTASIQIRKLQGLGISEYIKYIVTSEEVGVEKPNPKIFQRALKKLNLELEDVIMIGDDENKDIIGSQNLGIKSYKVIKK